MAKKVAPASAKPASPKRLQRRLAKLEGRLASEKWTLTGHPRMLPDGWPDHRPKS